MYLQAAERLGDAMAAMKEQAVRYCLDRGLEPADWAQVGGGSPSVERPLMLRDKSGEELARFWFEQTECSIAVRMMWA